MSRNQNIKPLQVTQPRVNPLQTGWLLPEWVEGASVRLRDDGTEQISTAPIDRPDLLHWIRANRYPSVTMRQYRTSLRRLCIHSGPGYKQSPLREDVRVVLAARVSELGRRAWGCSSPTTSDKSVEAALEASIQRVLARATGLPSELSAKLVPSDRLDTSTRTAAHASAGVRAMDAGLPTELSAKLLSRDRNGTSTTTAAHASANGHAVDAPEAPPPLTAAASDNVVDVKPLFANAAGAFDSVPEAASPSAFGFLDAVGMTDFPSEAMSGTNAYGAFHGDYRDVRPFAESTLPDTSYDAMLWDHYSRVLDDGVVDDDGDELAHQHKKVQFSYALREGGWSDIAQQQEDDVPRGTHSTSEELTLGEQASDREGVVAALAQHFAEAVSLRLSRDFSALDRHFCSCFSNPEMVGFAVGHPARVVGRRLLLHQNAFMTTLLNVDMTREFHLSFRGDVFERVRQKLQVEGPLAKPGDLLKMPKEWLHGFTETGRQPRTTLVDLWVPTAKFDKGEMVVIVTPSDQVTLVRQPGHLQFEGT